MGTAHKRPDFSVPGSEDLFDKTSKRALWVALKHLCAADTGEYDTALECGGWLPRMIEELEHTENCE
jgi:hypothetical protein